MVNELIAVIDEIAQYGQQPDLAGDNRMLKLERSLVELYRLQLDVPDVRLEEDSPDYNAALPGLRENIESNFPYFGHYKVVTDMSALTEQADVRTGDAIDDLHDIIQDLLEVKWRLQNASSTDGLWFFKYIFSTHIKEHLVDLLKYMQQGAYDTSKMD